ncbi:hypothetical protein MJO28_005271 [Puccinia striiformis f. sp. tritici]|uniref:Uncharacterized protein n=1 Tax=Puccinia striiformis f. sp. tritici TaxID=168172 RepID=A0ACC0EJV0_9BASI|nr:hypothetical protein MJO28_005271 [Puccinia striiformis f. sp. tritici]
MSPRTSSTSSCLAATVISVESRDQSLAPDQLTPHAAIPSLPPTFREATPDTTTSATDGTIGSICSSDSIPILSSPLASTPDSTETSASLMPSVAQASHAITLTQRSNIVNIASDCLSGPATDSTAITPLPSTTPISTPLITPEKISVFNTAPTIISLPSCVSSPAPTPVQENLTQSSTVAINSTLVPVSDNPFPTFTAPSNHSSPAFPLELQPAPEFLEYYDDEGNCFTLPKIHETEKKNKKKKKKKKTTTSGSNPSLSSPPVEVQASAVGALSVMSTEALAALERKNNPRYRPIEDSEFIGFDKCNDNPTSTPDNPILFYV